MVCLMTDRFIFCFFFFDTGPLVPPGTGFLGVQSVGAVSKDVR